MSHLSVTVVIVTNRGGPYLDEAVASVRTQTVQPREILLVDDGSPEPGLAARARELRIGVVRQEASGIAVGRNTGVAAAVSDWVAFLDDDDVWHPDRLAAQLAALREHPRAIASHTGGWYMDGKGSRFGVDWPAPQASSRDLLAAVVPPPRITTLLVRRDAYLAVGGCLRSTEPAEDNDLIMRLLEAGEFAAVDRPLVGYRRHTGNVTARGLAGRRASLRSIDRLRAIAERRGEFSTSDALRARRRAVLLGYASENLGELIESARRSEWRYFVSALGWAVVAAPGQSVLALSHRARAALSRRGGRK